MTRPTRPGRFALPAVLLAVALAACAPTNSALSRVGEPSTQSQAPAKTKMLTIGVTTAAAAMSIMGASTTVGGWGTTSELHSAGLITSDLKSRALVGRLAGRVPSIDDGSISVLPDGRMRAVYNLRPGITWQDGAPFTAQDLVFTHQLMTDPGIPSNLPEGAQQMSSTEAPDNLTFVAYFKQPYYLGNALGLRRFWPQPRHILGPAYERYQINKIADEVTNLPYWTSEYVHLGPFRLTSFDPGEGTEYRAYDGYFLGRPKIDVLRIRNYSDENTLFSHVLAGTIDMFLDGSLTTTLGFQMKERWDSSGEGTAYVRSGGGTRFIAPQVRPAVQREPAILQTPVRAALYHAIDRETLSDGTGYKEQAAWSILPPGDRLYEPTRDGLRRYPFEPDRAKAMLRDQGWTPGSDGVLRNNVDGRPFRTQISTTTGPRLWEMPVFADYWRRVGLEVEEITVTSAQVRNNEFRALYPGWEPSSSGGGDSLLGRLEGPAASPENRWTGNRGGYEDSHAQELLGRYYSSLSERDQLQGIKAMSDFIVETLPLLITYYNTDHVGIRKGVIAFDDIGGGAQAGQPYGTYTRNAHLWDIQ